jgi:adenylate kinase family enzyme
LVKILILGGPGSGKTTLGRRLSESLKAPFYELDVIRYDGGAGAERSLGDRLADVAALASQESWIAEGAFIGWTDALAIAADVIIWLDVPWRVACWRIISRHAKASLRGTNKHRGLSRLWKFTNDAKRYYFGPSRKGWARTNL